MPRAIRDLTRATYWRSAEPPRPLISSSSPSGRTRARRRRTSAPPLRAEAHRSRADFAMRTGRSAPIAGAVPSASRAPPDSPPSRSSSGRGTTDRIRVPCRRTPQDASPHTRRIAAARTPGREGRNRGTPPAPSSRTAARAASPRHRRPRVERLEVVLDDLVERRCLRPTSLVGDRLRHDATRMGTPRASPALVSSSTLAAAFPWPGAKSRLARGVWRLTNVGAKNRVPLRCKASTTRAVLGDLQQRQTVQRMLDARRRHPPTRTQSLKSSG